MKAFLKITVLSLAGLISTSLLADQYRIAFGSCYHQDRYNLALWENMISRQPDLFIMMGDNVYIDSDDPARFEKVYAQLDANPGFQKLRQNTAIMATWDDHDYGSNDGGKEFHGKQISKNAFVKFFNYKELHSLPENQGIFHSRTVSLGDKTIQVIVLDSRWYRDPLLKHRLSKKDREQFQLGPYRPHLDDRSTLLGSDQWQWLEKTLARPADLNIIVSSIQFLAENTAWETWVNFPHERNRLLKMIDKYAPAKTVVLSGDVHRAEFSAMPVEDWTLYEITSSGLSANIYPAKPNIHRIGKAFSVYNYGFLTVDSGEKGFTVKAGLYDGLGNRLAEHTIPLKETD